MSQLWASINTESPSDSDSMQGVEGMYGGYGGPLGGEDGQKGLYTQPPPPGLAQSIASMPREAQAQIQAAFDTNPPVKTQAAFVNKLYSMVEDASMQALIGWASHGNVFSVYDPQEFSRAVLPQFFKHNNWQSFVRQLNMYGFHKVNDHYGNQTTTQNNAPITWEFAHPCFKRDHPELLVQIKRKPSKHSALDPPPHPRPRVSSAPLAAQSLSAGAHSSANPGDASAAISVLSRSTPFPYSASDLTMSQFHMQPQQAMQNHQRAPADAPARRDDADAQQDHASENEQGQSRNPSPRLSMSVPPQNSQISPQESVRMSRPLSYTTFPPPIDQGLSAPMPLRPMPPPALHHPNQQLDPSKGLQDDNAHLRHELAVLRSRTTESFARIFNICGAFESALSEHLIPLAQDDNARNRLYQKLQLVRENSEMLQKLAFGQLPQRQMQPPPSARQVGLPAMYDPMAQQQGQRRESGNYFTTTAAPIHSPTTAHAPPPQAQMGRQLPHQMQFNPQNMQQQPFGVDINQSWRGGPFNNLPSPAEQKFPNHQQMPIPGMNMNMINPQQAQHMQAQRHNFGQMPMAAMRGQNPSMLSYQPHMAPHPQQGMPPQHMQQHQQQQHHQAQQRQASSSRRERVEKEPSDQDAAPRTSPRPQRNRRKPASTTTSYDIGDEDGAGEADGDEDVEDEAKDEDKDEDFEDERDDSEDEDYGKPSSGRNRKRTRR